MIRVPARPASGHLLAGKRTADPFVLFAVEGALLQLFCSVNGFANNQFATGLGATDLQIGLIQTVPNVVALILLLPLGILADRRCTTPSGRTFLATWSAPMPGTGC